MKSQELAQLGWRIPRPLWAWMAQKAIEDGTSKEAFLANLIATHPKYLADAARTHPTSTNGEQIAA